VLIVNPLSSAHPKRGPGPSDPNEQPSLKKVKPSSNLDSYRTHVVTQLKKHLVPKELPQFSELVNRLITNSVREGYPTFKKVMAHNREDIRGFRKGFSPIDATPDLKKVFEQQLQKLDQIVSYIPPPPAIPSSAQSQVFDPAQDTDPSQPVFILDQIDPASQSPFSETRSSFSSSLPTAQPSSSVQAISLPTPTEEMFYSLLGGNAPPSFSEEASALPPSDLFSETPDSGSFSNSKRCSE